MQVEMLTKEDLKQFKAELLRDLKDVFNGKVKQAKKQWLKSHEVRKLLGISPGTLQTLRINGTVPYTKIGGLIYYRYEDIIGMLEKGAKR